MSLVFLFLLSAFPLSAADFFHSDSLGIKGEALPAFLEQGWVLEISEEGSVRTLYEDGKECKRWEVSMLKEAEQGEDSSAMEESYFYKGLLRSKEIRNDKAMLLDEKLYDSSGKLIQEKHYTYSPEGKLEQVQGSEKQEMLYRPDGSLRSMISPEGRADWRASDFSENYLDDFYVRKSQNDQEAESRFRYEGRRLVEKSLIFQGEFLEKTEYDYDEEGFLHREIFTSPKEKLRRVSCFNSEGQPLSMEEFEDEMLSRFEEWHYKDGLLISRYKQDSSIRRRWDYEYKGADPKVWKTRAYVNGRPVKVSSPKEDSLKGEKTSKDEEASDKQSLDQGNKTAKEEQP